MDFDLTDEQRLLKDSVDRLISDQYQFEQRKKYMTEPDGWSRAAWQQYAELGLLGLPFAEAHGGFGGGQVGYNWSGFGWGNQVVLGVVTDIQGSDIGGSFDRNDLS